MAPVADEAVPLEKGRSFTKMVQLPIDNWRNGIKIGRRI